MALGALLKQARQEAGLSQRQLCGEEITRNMLSQIENGSARPSMDTLGYLAKRLGKPVSYFLEEETASSNQELMRRLRGAYAQGDFEQVLSLLEQYQAPDTVFDQEANLLHILALLDKAEAAITQGRQAYGISLLEQAEGISSIYGELLGRRRLLLLGMAQPKNSIEIAQRLSYDDAELLLRARAAMLRGDYSRSAAILDAAENQQAEQWCLLRGEVCFALKQYAQAIVYFTKAEDQALAQLEQCYEQLEDYKMAYHYARLRREK